jgi:hypothetical protein
MWLIYPNQNILLFIQKLKMNNFKILIFIITKTIYNLVFLVVDNEGFIAALSAGQQIGLYHINGFDVNKIIYINTVDQTNYIKIDLDGRLVVATMTALMIYY